MPEYTRNPVSPLSADHVIAMMSSRSSGPPLSTPEIAELCEAAYPHFTGISTNQVREWLRYLERRDRVVHYYGRTDADQLRQLGVAAPDQRASYWTLKNTS